MNHLHKGKAKYILVWASMLLSLMLTLSCRGNNFTLPYFHRYLTSDTIPEKTFPLSNHANDSAVTKENAALTDTVVIPLVDTIPYKISKDSLQAPVVYHADDSVVLDVPAKKILLYGKLTAVKYMDNELTAPHIEFDQQTGIVHAYLVKDSVGNVIAYPAFNQAEFKTVSDSIRFNMRNGKGLTKGTYTQQGEIFVYAEKIKKTDPDIFYAWRGRFTTCNLDTPHFAFVSKKIKFINKKMAYTGPVHPEVEGVPIPVYLPFGIYPLRQERHSGILAPTFTANEQLGLALEGLGYYKIINDNWDVVVRGTIYSYGGWTAGISPRYFKRYRYQGSMSFDMQHFRDIDQSGARTYNLRWSHVSDTRARPGVSFNANVNIASSKFNSSIPNAPQRNFENQLNSSITYAKVWKDKPFNLTVSANHNQNTNSKIININLPDIAFNVNTLYPFRRKEPIGEYKWYENVGIALNTNVRSSSSFYDTLGNFFQQLTDKFQWGGTHNVPLTLSLPQMGNVQLAPNITYRENWYYQKMLLSWNGINNKLDTVINKGFYTAREMNFSMQASTRIFGMFTFKKSSRVQAIRHEIRPSLSVNYKPDMNKQFWHFVQVNSSGATTKYSVYNINTFPSAFSEGKFAGLSFGLDNNIQMKVRSRKDTSEGGIKKISLLDGLSINGSYNFLADSFRLSFFTISARTNLFEKINITANGTLNPYLNDDLGRPIDRLVWSKRPISLGKLISGSVAVQSQFQGGAGKNTNIPPGNNPQQMINPVTGLPLDDYQREAAYINNNTAAFVDFNIPWSINFSYSLSFQRNNFETVFSQNVNWNGTLNLTPKWQIGMNAFYNITDKQLGSLSMSLSREMHCWQMAIDISPVGRYRFFNISISPKSGLLRDLRINRRRFFYDL